MTTYARRLNYVRESGPKAEAIEVSYYSKMSMLESRADDEPN
jgi:hypothetical protein